MVAVGLLGAVGIAAAWSSYRRQGAFRDNPTPYWLRVVSYPSGDESREPMTSMFPMASLAKAEEYAQQFGSLQHVISTKIVPGSDVPAPPPPPPRPPRVQVSVAMSWTNREIAAPSLEEAENIAARIRAAGRYDGRRICGVEVLPGEEPGEDT